MKAGLITHSTETVATRAVTSAGIAATSENSATTRLCSRAPARAARRAARRRRSSRAISTSRQRTISPSPPSRIRTTPGVGMIGVKPAKVTKVASARTSAPPTAIGPNTPEIRRSSSRGPSAGAAFAVGLLLRLMDSSRCEFRRRRALRPSPELRNCNSVARLRQNGGETHLNPRTPRRSRSRIFLRSVLRLRPRISAALIWLPRVTDSVAAISGTSRSRRTR